MVNESLFARPLEWSSDDIFAKVKQEECVGTCPVL